MQINYWEFMFMLLLAAIVLIPLFSIMTTLVYPLWLVPPYADDTFYVHLILTCLWIFLVWWAHRRYAPGKQARGVLMSVLLLIFAPCGCCMMASLNIPVPGIFSTLTCEEPREVNGRLEYQCTRQAIEERTVYTLEGREGWPVLHMVDSEFYP